MKYLFIAEKPSLMREVQSCYKNHRKEIQQKVGSIEFLALSGHACRNAEPEDYQKWTSNWQDIEYPMVPEKWKIKAIKGQEKKLASIKSAAADFDGIIVGTDSDTEGYGIYYLIENYLGITNKKALRFIEHSLTDKEILESLLCMTDYHSDPVHRRFVQSFILRSRLDWLYGMNITRMMTVKSGELLTVGRVKAVTIKLVYDNSLAIENFHSRTYYQLYADYAGFSAVYIGQDGKPVSYDQEVDISSIQKRGIVTRVDGKEQKVHAPKLYDLSSLQMDAGQMLGLTPKETLDTLQSLYEKHKAVSYPRTQCRYVSKEKAREFPELLRVISVFPELDPSAVTENVKIVQKDRMIVNDKEVQKESHDALLPTSVKPDLTKMNQKEISVLRLIYTKFYAQFMPQLTEQLTVIETNHEGKVFRASGKRITHLGWRKLYGKPREALLPDVEEGMEITAEGFRNVKKKTQPPKRLTQHTLIAAMENIANQIEDRELRASLAASKGIGTAATRDTIIADIIKRGYISDRKGLYITPYGKRYVEQLKNNDLISPVFAAQTDYKIKRIQRGELDFTQAYKETLQDLYRVCGQIGDIHVNLPKCPFCGSYCKTNRAGYFCDCGLAVYRKVNVKKTLSDEEIRILLKNMSLPKMDGFYSKKTGKTFSAALVLGNDRKVHYSFIN